MLPRYQILMGDNAVTMAYDINALPATYLIDKKGRVAISYIGVVIDKNAVESSIKADLVFVPPPAFDVA